MPLILCIADMTVAIARLEVKSPTVIPIVTVRKKERKLTKNSEELAQKATYLGPYGDLSSASW